MTTDTQGRSAKVNYEWTTEIDPAVSGLPMCSTMNGLRPKLAWLKETISTLLSVVKNTKEFGELSFSSGYDIQKIGEMNTRTEALKEEIDQQEDEEHYDVIAIKFTRLWSDFSGFMLGFPGITQSLTDAEKTAAQRKNYTSEFGLEKYDAMYQSLSRPLAADHIHDNLTFAYLRVAGSNPMLLKRLEALPAKFPLSEVEFNKVLLDDTLAGALKEHRVYFLDYGGHQALYAPDGLEKDKTGVGYSAAPMALFVVRKSDKRLFPVAIRCGQTAAHAVFLCSEKRDEIWGWEMAKSVVQCADEIHHEMVSHLAQTHFVSEVFAVATLRAFDNTHHIYRLLISHYEGTNFINNGAVLFLMQGEQFVDTLFAADRSAVCAEVVNKRMAFNIMDSALPTQISQRGLDDTVALPECPYRDDGLLIWNALSSWVSSYVDLWYQNDLQVFTDLQVQKWSNDIISHGKLAGFKPVITVKALKDILTVAIFTASAQHAAVNFSQPAWMSYTPSMSGSLLQHIPSDQWGKSNADWLGLLSSYNQASLRITVYSLLGSVKHGGLAQYLLPGTQLPLLDIKAAIPLALYRNKLASIETQIIARNATRLLPYEYLLPSKIPASTNI
jgi:arachidonate 15-lipoxygenase